MLTKVQTPSEFLARWDDAGNLKGAHIAFRVSIQEDGKEIDSFFVDPQPVGLAGATGFPISQILDALHVTALADAAAKDVALTQAKTDLAVAVANLDLAKAKETEALAKAADLQSKLDALTAVVDANGIPVSVTMVQAREQLIRIGLNSAVQTALAAMPGVEGEVARMKFDTSTTVARASKLVAALAQTLSKDAAWLDQFFVDAKKI